MPGQNPLDTVNKLIEALNRGDLDAAVALYEPHATLVAEPGMLAKGTDSIRTALEGFIALRPTLRGETHQIIEGENLALFCSKWRLKGTAPDGKSVENGWYLFGCPTTTGGWELVNRHRQSLGDGYSRLTVFDVPSNIRCSRRGIRADAGEDTAMKGKVLT